MSANTTATEPNKAETAVSYAALILADEGIDITADKLQILLKAANIEDVEPIWAAIFAKALQGKDVKDILTAVSTSHAGVGRAQAPVDEGTSTEPSKDTEVTDDDPDGSDMEGGMFDLFG